MILSAPKTALLLALFFSSVCAEECPKLLMDSAAVISAEGRFINREHSRIHVDIIWQHQPFTADTFDISVSGKESFRYVSAENFRYIELKPENFRRLMAMHHLKENIGESPIKLDDLELLARGAFLCPDSQHSPLASFLTAKSQTWQSLTPNTFPTPDSVQMSDFNAQNKRTIRIHSWKPYDNMLLPTILDFWGNDYHGSLWIRTARKIETQRPQTESPKKIQPDKKMRLWNWLDIKSEIPLEL